MLPAFTLARFVSAWTRALLIGLLASLLVAPAVAQAKPVTPDYSQEAVAIESFVSNHAFQIDGTGTQEVTARMRIQTDAGVQQWGLLTFSYQKANETVEIAYVRVRKADGTVVITPPENIQDMESEVSRAAPLYSDLRQKQVAVKGLSPGDVLEYRVHWQTHTPQVVGQFWLNYNFTRDGIVLDEQLEVSVPRERSLKVKNSDVQPAIREEGTRRIYIWKTSNLRRKSDEEKSKESKKEPPPPSVQMTSFRSWEELGKWYDDLQRARVVPSAEVRAKAAELTRNAATDLDKVRAIYRYVSTEFRYIGIDFGAGRYQPHAAADVLSNQYGDCKDKHTLLASLLQAVGITAYPVLVSSSRKIDEDVPSPAQFDHVISRVTLGNDTIWLDTTPEVVPFGLLLYGFRDKQSLLVSDKPQLVKTPAAGAISNLEQFDFEGKLDDDGVLTGEIRRSTQGDGEVLVRLAFRHVAQPQWKQLVQNISYGTGFAGTVDDVKVSSPVAIDQPFEFSYSYNRKDYADWSNRRILPALPPFALPTVRQEDEKSVDPVELGPPARFTYTSKMQMPPSYTPEVPANVDLSNDYAEYHADYELKQGLLTAQRRLVIKQHEVPVAKQAEWKKFVKATEDDAGRYIVLTAKDQKPTIRQNDALAFLEGRNPEAVRIWLEAGQAFQRGDLQGAVESCRRVLVIDPKFPRAWAGIAGAYMAMRRTDDAIDAFRKEMEVNPGDVLVLRGVALAMTSAGKHKDAIEAWRKLLKVAPEDVDAADRLSGLLISDSQYSEAIGVLEPAVERNPQTATLRQNLGTAYMRAGELEKGIATLQKAVDLEPTPLMMNNLAYELADKNLKLDLAEQWALRAVKAEAEETQLTNLTDLRLNDLQHTSSLGSYWDTLGWVYFRRADLAKAEEFLYAAWELLQAPTVGDHLAQLYEKQGKRTAAAKIYAQALKSSVPSGFGDPAAKSEIQGRLKHVAGSDAAVALAMKDAPEALSRARTIHLTKIVTGGGSAEFFVLVTTGGKIEEVKFISGSEQLHAAEGALRSALAGKMNPHAPLNAPVKIVRRGIVFCSPGGSGCDIALMTPDSVHSVN
ncbi:MAG: DUF3857 domain-containing protein [Acidobacteriia bacterium]|nr:DUF3857 domain-containing protein [Terriglobia bacterium]